MSARGVPERSTIAIADAKIDQIHPSGAYIAHPDDTVLELGDGELVVPGLVDLHCHGAFGVDFSNADAETARNAIRAIHATGTTTTMASLVTAKPEMLVRQLAVLADLVDEGLLAGLHLEGPFLAEARCGAQDPRWLLQPDLVLTQQLIDSARGHLRTMTYAPELTGSDQLVTLLVSNGVTPSLGHTACSSADAARSLSLVAGLLEALEIPPRRRKPTVTHLFNAMEPLHHRSPGALSACLRAAKAGSAVVELIADNTHLHPDLVAMMFELLGADNITLVTDSMAAAGLRDGQYRLGPAEVTVQDKVARVSSTGAIAGGTAHMIDLVRNVVHAGVSIQDAIKAASFVPGGIFGGQQPVGQLVEAATANLLVLNPDLNVLHVMRQGRWLSAPHPS